MSNTEIPATRILVAEDSPTQASLFKHTLEEMGYEVFVAADGGDALEMVDRVDPHIILSDVIMPGMDGFELTWKLREEENYRHIPIVLLTSLSGLEDILRGLEMGADSYLIKPVTAESLESGLNRILENRELLCNSRNEPVMEVNFQGECYRIRSGATTILNLLFSSYESAQDRNLELEEKERDLQNVNEELRRRVEEKTRELETELNQITMAEGALLTSEEQLRELVNQAEVGIFTWTTDGTVVLANQHFRQLFGIGPEEDLQAVNMRDILAGPEGDDLFHLLSGKGAVSEWETSIQQPEGNRITLLISAGMEEDLISGMVLDISYRKEAEERLMKQKRLLASKRDKATEAEKLKTSFLAHMHSEILTPLHSLAGFAELMEKEQDQPEKVMDHAEQISKSGNQLIQIVENIIDIARIESGEMKIRETPCQIHPLLLDLYDWAERHPLKKEDVEIVLKREEKGEGPCLLTEPFRLKSVLSNLLGNALKSTDQGIIEFGYMIHRKEADGGQDDIQFWVKDTGSGMSQKKLNLIFDRFRKKQVSYMKLSEDEGLGLPITRAYVELLGGQIWYQSESNEGTSFYLTLPCRELNATGHKKTVAAEEESLLFKNHMKILIAEDMESNYILLEALLKGYGPTLIWTKNGREAVDCFRHQRDIDLILMDLRMPVMSGYEAVEEIRRFDQEVPIIVQTAFAREEEKESILNLGCNSFLTKPINRKSLIREINRVCRQAQEI